MKDGKFSYGMYIVALVAGLASGLSYSKAFYHKGKRDAYQDCAEKIEETMIEVEKALSEK
jgi:hypothetical protein